MKAMPSGSRAWLVQRMTAVLLLAFIVFALARFALDRPHSYEGWRDWAAGGPMGVAVPVFFMALLAHAWIGVRDVAMDYVKPPGIRIALLTLVAAGLVALGLWVVRIVAAA